MSAALKVNPLTRNGAGSGKWWLIVEEASSFQWIEVFGPYPSEGDAWEAAPRAYQVFYENDTNIASAEVRQMKKKMARALSSSEGPLEAI